VTVTRIKRLLLVFIFLFCSGCTPQPIEMTDAEMKLDSFKLQGIWSGTIHAPWLGGDVDAMVDAEDSGIVESQYTCVRTACCLSKVTLQKTQRFLFDHYQNEIYGSIAGYADGKEIDFREITPTVANKEQLWALLPDVGLGFPPEHRIADDCFFQLTAECPWDEEHGLAILFDRSGDPIEIGGQDHHF
jgi:hypothetical protein